MKKHHKLKPKGRPTGKKPNQPVRIPLSFEQIVAGMLKTPPLKKKPKK